LKGFKFAVHAAMYAAMYAAMHAAMYAVWNCRATSSDANTVGHKKRDRAETVAHTASAGTPDHGTPDHGTAARVVCITASLEA
jgi:hypothetical protein